MDIMTFKIKLMQGMYNEVRDMKYEYVHKDLPIQEEVPFNIEYHIGRYHVYRELLEDIDKDICDKIDSECTPFIDTMHNFIDDFIKTIRG